MPGGYVASKAEWRGHARHLTEIDLLEVSVVLFGAQPQAMVDGMKSKLGDR
jgi:hypothetical protein